jgi:hypothetical protein
MVPWFGAIEINDRVDPQGTHVGGAHIEQVPRIVRAVSEAATDLFRRLNHNDFGRAYG